MNEAVLPSTSSSSRQIKEGAELNRSKLGITVKGSLKRSLVSDYTSSEDSNG